MRSLLVALLLVLPATLRADDLDELVKRIPGDMNTVAVINVRAINNCPRAIKENWKDVHETEYLAGAMAIPSWVPVLAIGSDIQPGWVTGGRSLALIPIDYNLSSDVIAKKEGGVVQTVDDLTLVLSPQRGYIGFPAANMLAVSGTLPRQDFARWVRGARKPEKPAISAYLQDAVAANKTAHIMVATELKDMIDPTSVRAAIQLSGATVKESELDAFVKALAGARGIIFTANIAEKSPATIRVDFDVHMEFFLPMFAKVWPKALELVGLDVAEFKNAEPVLDGKSIRFKADLSDTSLRQILSLVHAPGNAVESKDATPPVSSKDATELSASIRYYKAVNQAVDDLRAQRQEGTKARDYAQSAVFYDSFASKIEKLSIQNVNPVLVQYGMSTATKLRSMANSLRGTKMQLEAFDNYKSTTWLASSGGGMGVNPWRGYRGYGGYGGGGASTQLNTNVQEMNTKSAELIAQLEPERAKMWSILQSDRSGVRKEMLDKYKIDFDQYKR